MKVRHVRIQQPSHTSILLVRYSSFSTDCSIVDRAEGGPKAVRACVISPHSGLPAGMHFDREGSWLLCNIPSLISGQPGRQPMRFSFIYAGDRGYLSRRPAAGQRAYPECARACRAASPHLPSGRNLLPRGVEDVKRWQMWRPSGNRSEMCRLPGNSGRLFAVGIGVTVLSHFVQLGRNPARGKCRISRSGCHAVEVVDGGCRKRTGPGTASAGWTG